MSRELTESEILKRLMNGLKEAAGSAHQLAHSQQNPSWLQIRDLLENMRTKAAGMVMAKAMPRQDVLKMLDRRQAAVRTN